MLLLSISLTGSTCKDDNDDTKPSSCLVFLWLGFSRAGNTVVNLVRIFYVPTLVGKDLME